MRKIRSLVVTGLVVSFVSVFVPYLSITYTEPKSDGNSLRYGTANGGRTGKGLHLSDADDDDDDDDDDDRIAFTTWWKTATRLMMPAITAKRNHQECLMCNEWRFLLPLKRHQTLEQVWECQEQDEDHHHYHHRQEVNARIPSTVILGTQKGGTTMLAQNLLFSHPDIVPTTKELHFFNRQHALFRNGIPANTRIRYQQTMLRSIQDYRKENATHYVDATPANLFLSSRIPHWLLCTAPWVKAVVVLRNPVDRAYSEYNMLKQSNRFPTDHNGHIPSFEEFIGMDILNLQRAGVIRAFSNRNEWETFSGSTAELQAWDTYLSETRDYAPIGRGLYALQLRHWHKAFERYNKPSSDLLLIQSETMKLDPNKVYRQVLDHMNLAYHHPPPPSATLSRYANTRRYDMPMLNETRAMLIEFFRPFNDQLAQIIGDEWHGAWE